MNERPTPFELLTRAYQSKNLSMHEWRSGDVDWLAAAGACQVGRDPLPFQVARLLSGDYAAALHILGTLKRKLAAKGPNHDYGHAEDALEWWADPTCDKCDGRAYKVIPDTPNLSDEICPFCVGTGHKLHRHASQSYNLSLAWLDQAAGSAAGMVRAKVA